MTRIKNPFFRFKQFTVYHDQTALKVCTEACILGAYTDVSRAKRVLDIGTGTGLLALMLAQRNNFAAIEAVEIDKNACQQAQQNVAASPFAAQIVVHQTAIQDFTTHECFDLIVANPPFFNNHLRSPDQKRNQALHTDALTFEDLAAAVARLLSPEGRFVLLLPEYETQLFTLISQAQSLFPTKQLAVFQQINKPVFRLITTFERTSRLIQNETLTIYEAIGGYSQNFRELLKDYYLEG